MLVQNVTSLALLVPMAMDAIRYVNVRMELIVTLSMEFVRVRLDGWGKSVTRRVLLVATATVARQHVTVRTEPPVII